MLSVDYCLFDKDSKKRANKKGYKKKKLAFISRSAILFSSKVQYFPIITMACTK